MEFALAFVPLEGPLNAAPGAVAAQRLCVRATRLAARFIVARGAPFAAAVVAAGLAARALGEGEDVGVGAVSQPAAQVADYLQRFG